MTFWNSNVNFYINFKANNIFLFLASVDDLAEYFPDQGEGKGVASFIVSEGTWSLYLATNGDGPAIKIRGKTEFGPGTDVYDVGRFARMVKSIKRIDQRD